MFDQDTSQDHCHITGKESCLEAPIREQDLPPKDGSSSKESSGSPDESCLENFNANLMPLKYRTLMVTPAPRARSNQPDKDISTLFPRRKSFLLSIVNSTTRSRLTQLTPHPRRTAMNGDGLPDAIIQDTSPHKNSSPSQPLSRNSEPTMPKADYGRNADIDISQPGNSSFVSTASSHDLTVYNRANASFDPVTGAQGIGRFNAGKLNSYLHGLNRRLQEENEFLANSLEDRQRIIEEMQRSKQQELSEVMEIEGAEQWVQEKEEMEQKNTELKRLLEMKEGELQHEKAERQREKERWKERLSDVEKGVGNIIKGLEKRATDAEQKVETMNLLELRLKSAEKDLRKAEHECGLLKQRNVAAEAAIANDGQPLNLTDDISGKGAVVTLFSPFFFLTVIRRCVKTFGDNYS